MFDGSYAGDISPQECWELLETEQEALLIDVRTDAEMAYVGAPDVSSTGKQLVWLPWKVFPSMSTNPEFVPTIESQITDKARPLLFICRSGVRSKHAAQALTAVGFTRCYNVSGGFEGDRDPSGHRGKVNGWKVACLPWGQS